MAAINVFGVLFAIIWFFIVYSINEAKWYRASPIVLFISFCVFFFTMSYCPYGKNGYTANEKLIKAGVAKYTVNEQTGKTSFVLITNNVEKVETP